MGVLASFSVKQNDGSYKNYTISISDEVNQYGQNVSVYEEQTKEQRDAKEKKKYLGNGQVFWTDGSVKAAPKKGKQEANPASNSGASLSASEEQDLPF